MNNQSRKQAESAPIALVDVGKCYRIYANPQDRFRQALRDRFGTRLGTQKQVPLYREHWALRDVSFRISPGEAVGILGRNGAGKSTLLQIIAGTLAPSTGQVHTSGRITALLELGSGFNPEFTGRENVYHNAQILGLSRSQTEQKLDDILSFADIGDFVDQPVKTYSSGMMMRLAFSVQISVSPKILIVDEALSVGDMFFQSKCMARINRLVDDGVTLLFVSHDIGSVRQVCGRALMIENGNLACDGRVVEVSDRYTKVQLDDRNRAAQSRQENSTAQTKSTSENTESLSGRAIGGAVLNKKVNSFGIEIFNEYAKANRVSNDSAEIINVQMLRGDQYSIDFQYNELTIVRVYAAFKKTLNNVNQSVVIRTLQGLHVIFMDTRLQDQIHREYTAGETYCFEWSLRLPLLHGQYGLLVAMSHPPLKPGDDWITIDSVPHAYSFAVAPRTLGMIDALVALPTSLTINHIT